MRAPFGGAWFFSLKRVGCIARAKPRKDWTSLSPVMPLETICGKTLSLKKVSAGASRSWNHIGHDRTKPGPVEWTIRLASDKVQTK